MRATPLQTPSKEVGSCERQVQNTSELKPRALRPSQPVAFAASLLPAAATHNAMLQMVHNASTLTPAEKKSLLRLCLKYRQVFNAGKKSLKAINSAIFEAEPPKTNNLSSVPPWPLNYVKRKAAA